MIASPLGSRRNDFRNWTSGLPHSTVFARCLRQSLDLKSYSSTPLVRQRGERACGLRLGNVVTTAHKGSESLQPTSAASPGNSATNSIPTITPIVIEPYGFASKPAEPQPAAVSGESHQVEQQPHVPRSDDIGALQEGRAPAAGSPLNSIPRPKFGRDLDPESGLPARWRVLAFLPAALWSAAWLLTSGFISAGYAAVAAASWIAAAAFRDLVPIPAATAAAAAAAAGGSAAASAEAAVRIAAVDWADVALRTGAGLAGGGVGGQQQVLAALQDAHAGPLASWAVTALLPGLCAVAAGCRSAAVAVQTGFPWLGVLAQLALAAAGPIILLVMLMPLRRFVAPLVPVLPQGRARAATLSALGAGGALCMVAVLTGLQASEVRSPLLGPTAAGANAAAAAAAPLLLQQRAVLYGVAAVASDVVVPLCTAIVAARWITRVVAATAPPTSALGRQHTVSGAGGRAGGRAMEQKSQPDGATAAAAGEVEARTRPKEGNEEEEERQVPSAVTRAVRGLAAGRLLLDIVLLLAMAAGQLSCEVSAMRLLGMLWLLQTARKL